ncbi:MAG: hypothetical protein V4772_14435, partial [Pseudomonadota bacterium]
MKVGKKRCLGQLRHALNASQASKDSAFVAQPLQGVCAQRLLADEADRIRQPPQAKDARRLALVQ